MEHSIPMVRPRWEHAEFFRSLWRDKNITILVCQRKTKDLIQLNLESILRFYPDIPILVVDGDSQDDSAMYLRWMQLKHPNINVWFRGNKSGGKHTSHGVTMDEAIFNYINTKYVLIMDSDTIMDRGGCVEAMLQQMIDDQNIYATGTLMLVSNAGDACRPPDNGEDILRYSHPSCSLMRVDLYKQMKSKFCDHGAPSVYVMKEAAEKGYEVAYFPIHLYVSHLSGSSWTEPRTIWNHDHDVFIRPFLTIIGSTVPQTDDDYDCFHHSEVQLNNHVILHGESTGEGNKEYKCSNLIYGKRFCVTGEYVFVTEGYRYNSDRELVSKVKKIAVENGAPDVIEIDGLKIYKRNYWQLHKCFI